MATVISSSRIVLDLLCCTHFLQGSDFSEVLQGFAELVMEEQILLSAVAGFELTD
jgi:hypothetical protein